MMSSLSVKLEYILFDFTFIIQLIPLLKTNFSALPVLCGVTHHTCVPGPRKLLGLCWFWLS